MPLGKLTILAGNEGVGKGTLLAWIAAQVTRGELRGDLRRQPAPVLYVADEDGFEDTIGPRVAIAGADLGLIHNLEPVGDSDALVIPDDVDEIGRLVAEHDIRIVVIDPLTEFIAASVDEWKNKPIRAAIAPLRTVLAEHDCACIAVMHLNKRQDSNTRNRISGSHAFNALARSTLVLAEEDADDPENDRRILAHGKANLSKRAGTLAFRIVERSLKVDKGISLPQPCATDFEKLDDYTVGDALGSGTNRGRKLDEAKRHILLALGDGGWHEKTVIADACTAIGLSESTIKRAAADLDVESRRGGFPAVAEWRLPHSQLNGDDPTEDGPTGEPTGPAAQNGRARHVDTDLSFRGGPADRRLAQGRTSEPTGQKRRLKLRSR